MKSSKPPHPETKRLFCALREKRLIGGEHEQTALANLLNVSPQVVTNWCSRGISKEQKLKIQTVFGISATWLTTGAGVRHIPNQTGPSRAVTEPCTDDYIEDSVLREREKRLMALIPLLDHTGLAILIDKANELLKEYGRD